MKELEYKYIIRKDEALYIEDCLVSPEDIIHTQNITHVNYYYDTKDNCLERVGATFRIRECAGRLEGTLKLHGKNTDALSLEIPVKIDEISDKIILNGQELYLLGSLYTQRKVIVLRNGMKLMIDWNKYLGTEDCELELEFTEENREQAEAFDKLLDLNLTQYWMISGYDMSDIRNKHPLSKYERFMRRKRGLRTSGVNASISVKHG